MWLQTGVTSARLCSGQEREEDLTYLGSMLERVLNRVRLYDADLSNGTCRIH